MPAAMRVTLEKFDAAVRAAGREVNYRPVLKAIRLDVIAETRMNFDRGATPDGTPWAPLKHPRPNSRGADQPLRDTDMMMASVTAPGATGNIDVLEDTKLEWGTNHEHAHVHQDGMTITPRVAKLLAIPATVEAQRAGSPRNFAEGRLEFRWGKGGGAGVAVEKTKGRGKSVNELVHFYFARSVTVPARPFLGITEEQATEYGEMTAEFAAEEMQKRIGGDGGE